MSAGGEPPRTGIAGAAVGGPGAHRPRKRFGQHFLHDPGVIARIVRAVAPRPGQALVEIGPGTGALTAQLLAAAGELDVVEIDRDLAARLESAPPGPGRLHVHRADALELDLAALRPDSPGLRWRVVGNLPYNISTPLLFHLLGQLPLVEDMVFMLQREVAERLCARAGSGAYGRLSVMVQASCEVDLLLRVGPGAFHPPPKVDSAVLALRPRADRPDAERLQWLGRVTALAFGQRRKTLRNALRGHVEAARLQALGIDPGARAETLDVGRFLALAEALAGAG